VRNAARTAVPWARVLATLGVTLPLDAHVTALRAMGDTIELEGAARDAGGVFTALEQARFTELSATAPLRRERTADGVTVERFTFRARVPKRRVHTPTARVAERAP
jgi:Tfp pilus assembly protein PilN